MKFMYDIHLIEYRQRRYSLNENPRVIQSRSPKQSLISLRTFTDDKYKDTSNFLKTAATLERDFMVLENISRSPDNITDQDNMFPTFQIDLDIEGINEEVQVENVKHRNKLYNFVVDNFNKLRSTEDASPSNSIIASDQPQEIENDKPKVLSQKENKIWKLVLNDASLSAARLSTGNSSIPVINNTNVRGDFTKNTYISEQGISSSAITKNHPNNENNDIFAMNLQEARCKYYNRT